MLSVWESRHAGQHQALWQGLSDSIPDSLLVCISLTFLAQFFSSRRILLLHPSAEWFSPFCPQLLEQSMKLIGIGS